MTEQSSHNGESGPQAQIIPDSATSAQIEPAIEALLIMSDEARSAEELAQSLQVSEEVVVAALHNLAEFYDSSGRGFELRSVGSGWRLWTRPEFAPVLQQAVLHGQTAKLSQAALETLAVIAYLQPVSRSRISGVRGVNVDQVVRTLLARELIFEHPPTDAHSARLYGTTDHFLERMGLTSLAQLPDLAPYLPDATDLESELSTLVDATQQAELAESTTQENTPAPKATDKIASDPEMAGSSDG